MYRSLAQPGAQLDDAAAASMISGYRSNNSLPAVTLDPELTRLARGQAEIMAQRDKLDHNAGKPFIGRLKASGYDARTAAENIGAGYHTLAEAFSGWRDSPPHKANMLLKGATRMGIAAVYTPKSKYKVYLGADHGRAGRRQALEALSARLFSPALVARVAGAVTAYAADRRQALLVGREAAVGRLGA